MQINAISSVSFGREIDRSKLLKVPVREAGTEAIGQAIEGAAAVVKQAEPVAKEVAAVAREVVTAAPKQAEPIKNAIGQEAIESKSLMQFIKGHKVAVAVAAGVLTAAAAALIYSKHNKKTEAPNAALYNPSATV